MKCFLLATCNFFGLDNLFLLSLHILTKRHNSNLFCLFNTFKFEERHEHVGKYIEA